LPVKIKLNSFKRATGTPGGVRQGGEHGKGGGGGI